MARRDNHQAARALADWARAGFTEANTQHITETYGVTSRTLWNWKKALTHDEELSGLFRDRLNDALNQDWAAQLDTTLLATINRMYELIQDEPDLQKVNEAFRSLSEVAITREVLREPDHADARGASPQARSENTGSPHFPN